MSSAGSVSPGVIPKIQRGEIKNVKSYRAALRQLAARPQPAGNTALALYDDAGNIHLQVFGPDAAGVRRLVFDRAIGAVPVPLAIPPGTARFGNAIEGSVLKLLSLATGQPFRSKRANAGGADIEAGELASRGVSARVRGWVEGTSRVAREWETRPAGSARAEAERVRWAGSRARRMLALIDTLSAREVHLVARALGALEAALGRRHAWIRRFRRAARGQLGVPV
jgi:hypothetical protein